MPSILDIFRPRQAPQFGSMRQEIDQMYGRPSPGTFNLQAQQVPAYLQAMNKRGELEQNPEQAVREQKLDVEKYHKEKQFDLLVEQDKALQEEFNKWAQTKGSRLKSHGSYLFQQFRHNLNAIDEEEIRGHITPQERLVLRRREFGAWNGGFKSNVEAYFQPVGSLPGDFVSVGPVRYIKQPDGTLKYHDIDPKASKEEVQKYMAQQTFSMNGADGKPHADMVMGIGDRADRVVNHPDRKEDKPTFSEADIYSDAKSVYNQRYKTFLEKKKEFEEYDRKDAELKKGIAKVDDPGTWDGYMEFAKARDTVRSWQGLVGAAGNPLSPQQMIGTQQMPPLSFNAPGQMPVRGQMPTPVQMPAAGPPIGGSPQAPPPGAAPSNQPTQAPPAQLPPAANANSNPLRPDQPLMGQLARQVQAPTLSNDNYQRDPAARYGSRQNPIRIQPLMKGVEGTFYVHPTKGVLYQFSNGAFREVP